MSNGKYTIGRGTKVYVAPLSQCDRTKPPSLTFTVGVGGAALNATSITVTLTGSITNTLYASVANPIYLLFKESNGREHLAVITDDIAAGATSLTVTALPRAIPAGATAIFPVLLGSRSSANFSNNDNQVDIMTFDNSGYSDGITTMLGTGLELSGYYSPLDAGVRTIMKARENFRECYFKVEFPAPGCDDLYAKGHVIEMFGAPTFPLEITADGVINLNVSVNSRGPVTITDPSVT